MERRTALAFLLIGLLTVVWIVRMQSIQKRRTAAPATVTPEKPAPVSPSASSPEPPASTEPAPSPTPTGAERQPALREDILLSGPSLKYESLWTNRGACLREARLKEYAERLGATQGVLLLSAPKNAPATFALRDPQGKLPLDTRNYELLECGPDRLVFAATFENGLQVIKEFVTSPNKYELIAKITFKNLSDKPQPVRYEIVAAGRVAPDAASDVELKALIGSRHPSGRIRILEKMPTSVKKESFVRSNGAGEPIVWAGAANRYFAAILQPLPDKGSTLDFISSASVEFLPQSEPVSSSSGRLMWADNVLVKLASDFLTPRLLKPGETLTDTYRCFMGPKKQSVLAAYPELTGLLDFGTFGGISRALLAMLRGFYKVIPNYGVGIVLLTIVVKICLFPITRKGQISMHRMQRLQPLVKEIQEKFKDDRQRQGREMMELYRKHNANPMSGCWPLLLQIPIFFGLFRMLQYAIELRQQGFVWWIRDLSRPDTIGYIGGFPINILPVLMVISWVVQQLTMPKPVDPQQAQTQKMMLIMPILFGFMFYGTASGLTLYWLTSTFLGIIEQKLIKMEIQRMEARGEFDVLSERATGRNSSPGSKRK